MIIYKSISKTRDTRTPQISIYCEGHLSNEKHTSEGHLSNLVELDLQPTPPNARKSQKLILKLSLREWNGALRWNLCIQHSSNSK